MEELYSNNVLEIYVVDKEDKVDVVEKGEIILGSQFDKAQKDLNNWKAPRKNKIYIQSLKVKRKKLRFISTQVSRIYAMSKFPTHFKKSIEIIPKKKWVEKHYQYRRISLPSYPSKILTCIIYKRIRKRIEAGRNTLASKRLPKDKNLRQL